MGDAPQMGLRSPEGWRGRLALADLRWVWAAIIALVIFGAYVLLWPTYERTLEAVCRDQYARARTAADTQGVDGVLPLVQDPKFAKRSISCGTLRRAGKL
jgi:hypothetical protein